MALNEADTCRVHVTPGLRDSGWENLPHSLTEQYVFADGYEVGNGQNETVSVLYERYHRPFADTQEVHYWCSGTHNCVGSCTPNRPIVLRSII